MELRVILMILISLSLRNLVCSMSNSFTISVHENDLIDDRLEGINFNAVDGEESSYPFLSVNSKSKPPSDVHLVKHINTKTTVRLVRISKTILIPSWYFLNCTWSIPLGHHRFKYIRGIHFRLTLAQINITKKNLKSMSIFIGKKWMHQTNLGTVND